MTESPDPPCPRCGAPRASGPECPRCRVIYAKARPRGVATVLADPGHEQVGGAGGAPSWHGDLDDIRRELLVRAIAPPAALVLAWVLVGSRAGHALVRTFLSMWVHETGHAVAAWFSGYAAFPGPWRTPVSGGREPFVVVALAAGLGALTWRGWRARRPALIAVGVGGLATQLFCTLLAAQAAHALITFGGDAGSMVLGAALVATIWTDPAGALGRGGLRWGFLGIGACALVDALDTWIRAWLDPGQLPLGEIEGLGLSDASTLMEVHGWSARTLTGRYVALGMVCLMALAAGYATVSVRSRARLGAVKSGGAE